MNDALKWRKKFLDSLDQQEAEQRKWIDQRDLLKRLVNRLAIACRGLSGELDAAVDRLSSSLKQELDLTQLQKDLHRLSAAVAALDDRAESRAGDQQPDQNLVRQLLTDLLQQLEVAPEARSELRELRLQVDKAESLEQQTLLISRVVSLINAQQVGLIREKNDLRLIVEQVSGQLDEVAVWLVSQGEQEHAARNSSEQLQGDLHQEVTDLNASVEKADDLPEIRKRVRAQLIRVSEHLDAFRQREEARMDEFRARNEKMNARIRELEQQADELQASIRREQQLALTDTLSGLPNRLAFRQRFEQDLGRWQANQQSGCLAVWDIDHFKRINDTVGHQAGDKAIRSIAQQLSRTCRQSDFVARFGGEEFVMILDGLAADSALQVAEKIRSSIEEVDFRHAGDPVRITASCGISQVLPGDTADSLFERADRALYRAKSAGRNRCILA